MLRGLFCRPGLVRGFGLVTQHLPGGEVVLVTAHGRGDRKRTGGAGILWAAPLPIAVAAAAGREEEEGRWTLPQGYNWENSVTAKGGMRWFVRPSLEKAADPDPVYQSARPAAQGKLLHRPQTGAPQQVQGKDPGGAGGAGGAGAAGGEAAGSGGAGRGAGIISPVVMIPGYGQELVVRARAQGGVLTHGRQGPGRGGRDACIAALVPAPAP
jgi:hypothetical protein